jgi:Protein of unknown function (DUF2721)
MTSATQITDVAHTIQLAVAPVFLFAGIGGFLNMCAGRLARIIDRARAIEPLLLKARGAEHERYVAEIRTLDKRISVVNNCILLGVMSACLTCLVVIFLFCTQLFGVDLGTMIALLFIASMLMIGAAFALFIQETRLGSRIVHIRNEILYHEAGD